MDRIGAVGGKTGLKNFLLSLRKAWEGAKALRGLWKTADATTKEWYVGAVLLELDKAGGARRD